MVRILAEENQFAFKWIDVTHPSPGELQQIANQYQLHASSVQDCLQPDHLPKYELIGDMAFVIARMYLPEATTELDTVQELTSKIAIFYTDRLVITIHRRELALIDSLKRELIDTGRCRGEFHLLNRIVRAVLFTYDAPMDELAKALHHFEDSIFLDKRTPPVLRGLYALKRKVDLIRRILILSRDIVENIDDPAESNPSTRDTRDLFVRLETVYNTLSDNINQLFNIYFSLSSQRTNEVIRVLTIFSVFFMPLTFVVGVYGMNFDYMPELRWRWGYPGVLLVMVGVTLGIFIWFKRKKWL